MGRSASSLLAVLMLLAPVPLAQADEGEEVYPEVAGTNVLHSDGVAGLKMEFPSDTRWFRGNVEITAPPETKKIFFGIRDQQGTDPWCDFCFSGSAEFMRYGSTPDFYVNGCDAPSGEESGCRLFAGVAELYFVANGPFTITVRFSDLSGSIELDATGEIRGEAVPIPIKGCGTVETCDHLSYGGLVRHIGLNGRPAFASSSGYTWADPQRTPVDGNPTYNRFISCVYPGFANESASADPQDHPYGCDAMTDPDDNERLFWWYALPWLNGGGNSFSRASFQTHGAQYFGFVVREAGVINPARSSAWALWVEAGISCESQDYTDCDRTVGG